MQNTKKHITLCPSNVYQKANNSNYLNPVCVETLDEFKKIIMNDYTCAKYKNNHRSKEDFIEADCVPFDVDNTHSDDPKFWFTPESLKELFTDVPMFIQYSRNHMKEKKGKAPRPKFHVIFPINTINDEAKYREFKLKVYDIFPYFDNGALDSARFFFGTKEANVDFIDGNTTLDEWVESYIKSYNAFESFDNNKTIQEGSRNKTLHRIAVKLLKRYGISETAKKNYREASTRCKPPLEKDELNAIWTSAVRFYNKEIKKDANYKSPEEYNSTKTSSSIIFDELLSLDEVILPEFPIELLPPALKDYAKDVAYSTQTPIDMAAICALATVALAMQTKYTANGRGTFHQTTNLYALIVAEPSERKSPVLNLMTKVIKKYEAEYNEKHEFQFKKSELEAARLEKALKKATKDKENGEITEEEYDEILKEQLAFKPVKPINILVDDITQEALAYELKKSNSSIGMFSAEGGIFNIMSGMYTRGVANIDIYLKSFAGEDFKVNRVDRPAININDCKLTLLLAIQPHVLRKVVNNPEFNGTGLTSRFLYSIPKSRIGSRVLVSEQINQDHKQAYESIIKEILEEPTPKQPTDINMTDDAYEVFTQFYTENEHTMPTINSNIKEWRGKICGSIIRIAAIIARTRGIKYDDFLRDKAVESTDEYGVYMMSKEDVEAAISIGKYFIEHAKFALNGLGMEQLKKDAKKLIETLQKRKPVETINARDVMRLDRTIKNAESAYPVLDILADYGYIKEKNPEAYTGKGRPAATKYLVNPAIYQKEDK